jgi:hypothetical protein
MRDTGVGQALFERLPNCRPISAAFEQHTLRIVAVLSDATIADLETERGPEYLCSVLRRLGIVLSRPYFFEHDEHLSRWLLAQRDRPPDRVIEQALRWRVAGARYTWTWAEIDKLHLPALARCQEPWRLDMKPHRPPALRPISGNSSSATLFWIGSCQRCGVNYWSEPSAEPGLRDNNGGFDWCDARTEFSVKELKALLDVADRQPHVVECNNEGVLIQRFAE